MLLKSSVNMTGKLIYEGPECFQNIVTGTHERYRPFFHRKDDIRVLVGLPYAINCKNGVIKVTSDTNLARLLDNEYAEWAKSGYEPDGERWKRLQDVGNCCDEDEKQDSLGYNNNLDTVFVSPNLLLTLERRRKRPDFDRGEEWIANFASEYVGQSKLNKAFAWWNIGDAE